MTCKKYKFLLFILCYLFLRVESFTPLGRIAHSTVLVENKLYFFGGVIKGCSNEVFYLDLSQQFNVETPPWTDLTSNSGLGFSNCWASTALTNNSIYLVGGFLKEKNVTTLVYEFDLKSGHWKVPLIQGKMPERRYVFQIVADNFGKIYAFGGYSEDHVNDMAILNTNEFTWSYGPIDNAPNARIGDTATLLSNGVIVYIGGREIFDDGKNTVATLADLNRIHLYDTMLSSWSIVHAKSDDQIESRFLHSAVLVSDENNGKIIIYGGSKHIDDLSKNVKVSPDLAVLNTYPFEWTIPQVSSNFIDVPSLTSHTANIFENYMIVAFGNITQPNASPLGSNSRIYLLDTRNYTWVDKFEPEPTPISNPPKPKPNQKIKIIIGTLSGIFGFTFLLAIGIFSYKLYQNKLKVDFRII